MHAHMTHGAAVQKDGGNSTLRVTDRVMEAVSYFRHRFHFDRHSLVRKFMPELPGINLLRIFFCLKKHYIKCRYARFRFKEKETMPQSQLNEKY